MKICSSHSPLVILGFLAEVWARLFGFIALLSAQKPSILHAFPAIGLMFDTRS
jgi:hypothetical protein